MRATDGRARPGALIAALVLALLALPGAALAADPVNNTSDSGAGSLRNALATANQGDVIAVPAGTYTLTSGELPVTAHDITIAGAGAGSTVINGNDNSRVFHVDLAVNGSAPSATIQDLTVTGGHAEDSNTSGGGGILNTNAGQLNLIRVVVTGNEAIPTDNPNGFGGGGVSNESSNGLSISDSTISGNILLLNSGGGSLSGGGGVHSQDGNLSIDGSTISGNILNSPSANTDTGGGGLFLGGGTLVILNSTISGNTATVPADPVDNSNGGGGMLVHSNSNAGIQNATIAGNTTSERGGGILASSPEGFLFLTGTIVASNSPTGCAAAGLGEITSAGANMETGDTCTFNAAGDAPNTDPLLGPLADNGGPTRTHALAAGSAAVDRQAAGCGSGSGLVRDQRGVSRPQGAACDVGAFELVPSVLPPPLPPPPDGALPPPVLGKTVNVLPVSGTVTFAIPAGASAAGVQTSQKGLQFRPLKEARQLPVRAFLNTRRGTVRLTSARDTKGATQTGTFASGLFQILQSRKRTAKGLTELRLKGSSFKSCTPRKRSKPAQAALSKKAIRRLRSNAGGRFRTRGRYSAATVRGTKWLTVDRCDGTLTKVTRGKVAVRDFRRKKSILVKRGKSYLAKPRQR